MQNLRARFFPFFFSGNWRNDAHALFPTKNCSHKSVRHLPITRARHGCACFSHFFLGPSEKTRVLSMPVDTRVLHGAYTLCVQLLITLTLCKITLCSFRKKGLPNQKSLSKFLIYTDYTILTILTSTSTYSSTYIDNCNKYQVIMLK